MFRTAALFVILSFSFSGFAITKNEWTPKKPIKIIVPWSAGGGTDLVTRVVAAELQKALKQNVVVVNQPGGSGSIGTGNALKRARDGYTWTAGAPKDLGTYIVTGKLDTKIQDWHLFLNSAVVSVISVNPKDPVQDFGQFLKKMKTDGKSIKVATSGVNSAGHSAMESIQQSAGGKYDHVSYPGGGPAVTSVAGATIEKGITRATSQLITEQIDLIKAKKLKPLAVLTTTDVTVDGYGKIPSVTKWIKNYTPIHIHFGLFIPKGVPENVVKRVEEIWNTKVTSSEALKSYAQKSGCLVKVLSGEAAQKAVWPSVQRNAWILHAGGKAKVRPDKVGIPKLKN